MESGARKHKLTLKIRGETTVVWLEKDDFCVGRSRTGEADVIADGAVEQEGVLQDYAKLGAVGV